MRFRLGSYVRQFLVVITLLYAAALNAQISSNSPVCPGGTIRLTVSATGTQYNWTGPNSFTSKSQNPVISPATAADAGVYTVEVVGPNGSTFYSASVNVVELDPPVVNNNYIACLGVSFTLFAGNYKPEYDYSWAGPTGTFTKDSLYFNPVTAAVAGSYTVTVSSVGCEPASSTFTITVNNTKPPTPVISTAATYCQDGPLNLRTSNGGGNPGYAWYGPDNFSSNQSNPIIDPADADNQGQYKLVYLDANGCPSDTAKKTITMVTAPVAATLTGDTTLCEGDTLILTATVNGTGSQFIWTTPTVNGNAKVYRVNGVTTAHNGLYTFNYSNGTCQSIDAKINVSVVQAPTAPVVNSEKPVYCEDDTLRLTTPSNAGETYAWKGPNGFTSATDVAEKRGLVQADSGYYSVRTTINGCQSPPTQIFINIKPTPENPSFYTNAPICGYFPLTVATTTGTVPGVTYTWTAPSGTTYQDSVTIFRTNYTDEGWYFINSSINGCTSKDDSIFVKVKQRIENYSISITSPLCENYHFYLSQQLFDETAYYIARKGNPFRVANERNYYIDSLPESFSGIYTIHAENTCDTIDFDTLLTVLPAPDFTIVGDTGICDYETRTLKIQQENQNLTYLWNTFQTMDEIIVDSAAIYSVVATTAEGCTTKVEHPVYYLCRPEVYVPNAFSPNGDGVNDRFGVDVHNVYDFKFEVFSRSGTKVFSTEDPTMWWDGKFGSETVKDGQYIFSIKFKTNYQYKIYEELIDGAILVVR